MKKKFKIGHKDLFNLNNLKYRNKNEHKYACSTHSKFKYRLFKGGLILIIIEY